MKHVMIDLETLATTADAVILSIGAVRFDIDSDKIDIKGGFYAPIEIEPQQEFGRRIDPETLRWWMKQSADAQKVFTQQAGDFGGTLDDLTDWFGKGDCFVWSNGADFDLPILAHAYRQVRVQPPWKFFNSRCYRTLKNTLPKTPATPAYNGTAHNAFDDAVKQAMHAQVIWSTMQKMLRGGK